MSDEIKCKHCGERRAPLGFAPFPNELGQRIAADICQVCWREWLQKQVQVINHFGVDVSSPDGQEFLFANMRGYLFGEAQQQPAAEIDTSKEGSIKW